MSNSDKLTMVKMKAMDFVVLDTPEQLQLDAKGEPLRLCSAKVAGGKPP